MSSFIHIVPCILHINVHCMLHIVYYILYIVYCILYIVQALGWPSWVKGCCCSPTWFAFHYPGLSYYSILHYTTLYFTRWIAILTTGSWFLGVFFLMFRSIFPNFLEYFSEFTGVFFQILSIFPNSSTEFSGLFFRFFSIFPNFSEFFP